MPIPHLQTNRHLLLLIKLRYGFIFLQLLVVLLAEYWFEYNLPYLTLKLIIAIELAVNMVLFYCYRGNRNAREGEYLFQVLLDILLLTILLYFAKGATNPFVSLLLIPVAIAAVTLSRRLLILVSFAALAAYSVLFFSIDSHQMHMVDMQQHFLGMWVNFVLSACVVVLVVASLAQAMRNQERFVSKLREEQLRQEQLVALGTTAAQFAHQLATPLATANLLTEELEFESSEADPLLTQLKEQLHLCSRRLQDFREMSEEVKLNSKRLIPMPELLAKLQQEVQLNFADIDVEYSIPSLENLAVRADTTLLPALLNLIQNAVQSSKRNDCQQIQIQCRLDNSAQTKQFVLTIRDFGAGLPEESLLELGATLVESEQGFGMGVLLSHATLERLGAQLRLYNHTETGAVAEILMELVILQ
ncbi:HAMP domain-containing sensor histidine kinase [Aliiglaciecola sp. 3_MG-2023]|uniref:sensor histidine kinase n=1 Tax=Aliiglaciecola sp. 3_MG-2023 TaxID=3062644 RepID=UPI0026E3CE27|nr:HAMP domain-containing sensor histidine kinase [Aliiglaciecola sp. 3_MG-2023]MDO6694581.1 HAMP domain-containing sensor histidine kinase [Aliiglaciecola sp. 3_MG-2023]